VGCDQKIFPPFHLCFSKTSRRLAAPCPELIYLRDVPYFYHYSLSCLPHTPLCQLAHHCAYHRPYPQDAGDVLVRASTPPHRGLRNTPHLPQTSLALMNRACPPALLRRRCGPVWPNRRTDPGKIPSRSLKGEWPGVGALGPKNYRRVETWERGKPRLPTVLAWWPTRGRMPLRKNLVDATVSRMW